MIKRRDIGFSAGVLTALSLIAACAGPVVSSNGGGSAAAAGGSSSAVVGSGGSGGSSSSTASSSVTTAGTGGQAPMKICPDLPPSTLWQFNCAETVSCGGGYSCGELDTPFDAIGCLRPRCDTDGDCLDIERCYRPSDFGPGCVASNLSCNDNSDGECTCSGTDDCGGAYCVPSKLYPGKTDPGEK